MADSRSAGSKAGDAEAWWRAYQLADQNEDDELRRLVAAGDDHARWQLAGWLADRSYQGGPDPARLAEAIETIRPLADAGDDVAELWLARWLADCEHATHQQGHPGERLAELRARADNGSYHAARELARTLADQNLLDELRARADRGDDHAFCALVKALTDRDIHEELRERLEAADVGTRQLAFDAVGGSPAGMNAMVVLADFGHRSSRYLLARSLARQGRLDELRQRADNGDDYARHWLDENLSQP